MKFKQMRAQEKLKRKITIGNITKTTLSMANAKSTT